MKLSLIIVWLALSTSTSYAQKINSQETDTLLNVSEFTPYRSPQLKGLIVPAVAIAYGFSALHSKLLGQLDFSTNAELREDHPNFALHADNYLQYAPIVAVYGLDLAGIKSKHNLIDRSALLLLSGAIMSVSVGTTKSATHRLRPNGDNYHSFPSGHTATAFMSAEFLHQEYKDQSPWYSIMGYTAATATGALRMYNEAHWFSDVIAGAGYGILSTKISYWVYPYIKSKMFHGKQVNTLISPVHQQGYTGLMFLRQF
ncbi:PAP2 superfamily protein [Arcticibacter svalbardensis MN12-7]|uniref:PAP2 superfamily protein n=1 Tax=Arcticibacter svalbardensis MN12-7 TaxID=1150600 RepID=R9GQV4_9SPHI|nr:phosphatase PAP2 family protein [Arcticibacter svalbardensis]EOR93935.1 PAP2 superfamily protein [Arcticibacter svalbardensis MN12-7]